MTTGLYGDGNATEDEGQLIQKYLFEEPIDQNAIQSVVVDGIVVWQKE